MSDRGDMLLGTAQTQIFELTALLSGADDQALRAPCPGREKLGDGTVAGVALHTAETYLRIATFAASPREHSPHGAAADEHHDATDQIQATQLIVRLTDARRALTMIADLTDEQFNSVPPRGQARFCDGARTLEQVLANMLKHQGRQIDALRAAIA